MKPKEKLIVAITFFVLLNLLLDIPECFGVIEPGQPAEIRNIRWGNPIVIPTGGDFDLWVTIHCSWNPPFEMANIYVKVYDYFSGELIKEWEKQDDGGWESCTQKEFYIGRIGPMPTHHWKLLIKMWHLHVNGVPELSAPSDTCEFTFPHAGPFKVSIVSFQTPTWARPGEYVKVKVTVYNDYHGTTEPEVLVRVYNYKTGEQMGAIWLSYNQFVGTPTYTAEVRIKIPHGETVCYVYAKAYVREFSEATNTWVWTYSHRSVVKGIACSPPGGCPVWSVYNGLQYETVRSLGIHSEYGVDVVQTDSYAVTSPFATDTLKIKLEEPVYFRAHGSVLDYISVKVNGQTATLTSAVHSSLGDVTSQISRSDDQRVKLAPGQIIELTFKLPKTTTVDTVEITVEGYNPWGVPGVPVKLTPLWLKILIAIAVFAFAWYIIKQLR